MQSLAQGGYSYQEVQDILHAQNRDISFRYELLDLNDEHLGWLEEVEAASVGNNALADGAKRTATFTVADPSPINLLKDRIRPIFRVRAPDGEWLEWSLGIFLLSTPAKDVTSTGASRQIEAFDKGVILLNDRVESRFALTAGTNYTQAVRNLLQGAGVEKVAISESTRSLSTDREWEGGTKKREIINDLLNTINFQSVWFDVQGRARSQPYISPAQAAIGYSYVADAKSIISPAGKLIFDTYDIPNKFIGYVSEPDKNSMRKEYTNKNPNSPLSTVNLGQTIVRYERMEAADPETLQAKVDRLAFEASQVYEVAEFKTATMPHHEEAEVLEIQLPGVADRPTVYSEHTWGMDLAVGAKMEHRVRRVVVV